MLVVGHLFVVRACRCCFLGHPQQALSGLAGDECALLLCGSEGGRVRIVLDYVCVKGRVYHDMRLYTKVTWTSCPCVHV